jgi:Zn-dependent membrane protease YugP
VNEKKYINIWGIAFLLILGGSLFKNEYVLLLGTGLFIITVFIQIIKG